MATVWYDHPDAGRTASTGLDCYFEETEPGKWRYGLENEYGNHFDTEYDHYGPFSSFGQARDHLQNNHANPGGWSVQGHPDSHAAGLHATSKQGAEEGCADCYQARKDELVAAHPNHEGEDSFDTMFSCPSCSKEREVAQLEKRLQQLKESSTAPGPRSFSDDEVNQDRLSRFSDTYKEHLTRAVTDYPDEYVWPVENVPAVHGRMMDAIRDGSYNKDSRAIKSTTKALGIPHTYQGIHDWLTGETDLSDVTAKTAHGLCTGCLHDNHDSGACPGCACTEDRASGMDQTHREIHDEDLQKSAQAEEPEGPKNRFGNDLLCKCGEEAWCSSLEHNTEDCDDECADEYAMCPDGEHSTDACPGTPWNDPEEVWSGHYDGAEKNEPWHYMEDHEKLNHMAYEHGYDRVMMERDLGDGSDEARDRLDDAHGGAHNDNFYRSMGPDRQPIQGNPHTHHASKLAQDGGGGGGDGGGGGGDGGGAAAGGDGGGDAGAASAPSGGDAGGDGETSMGHTCPDGNFTHVNHYTGLGCYGCGRCGWAVGYPYGRHPAGVHKHKKKKRKKPEEDYESYRDREDGRLGKLSFAATERTAAFTAADVEDWTVNRRVLPGSGKSVEWMEPTPTDDDEPTCGAKLHFSHEQGCPLPPGHAGMHETADYGKFRGYEKQADHSYDDDEPTCDADGKKAIGKFLDKNVCDDHLRYYLADAPSQLAKAEESIGMTTGADRIKAETLAQKLKIDMKAGAERLQEIAQQGDEDSSGLRAASTQETDMYNCDRCGVQATREAVTKTGRRLLCEEHAENFKVAYDTAGIENRVFPLHKEAAGLFGDQKGFWNEVGKGVKEMYDTGYCEGDCGCHGGCKCEDCPKNDIGARGAIYPFYKGREPDRIRNAQHIDLTNEGTMCECDHPISGDYGHKENGDCSADNCPCQVKRPKAASKKPQWIRDALGEVDEVPPTFNERMAAVRCRECEGTGVCSCGGSGRNCSECQSTGVCQQCGGTAVETGPDDEYDADRYASMHFTNLAATVLGWTRTSGAWDNRWKELKEKGLTRDQAQTVFNVIDEARGHHSRTLAEHSQKMLDKHFPAEGTLDYNSQAIMDPNEDRLHPHDVGASELEQMLESTGGWGTPNWAIDQGLSDDEYKAGLEQSINHLRKRSSFEKDAQSINLPGQDPWAPKGETEQQLKGECMRCGKDVTAGDASDFGDDQWSCSNCAPLVAQNLDIYKSASRDDILAYLYDNDPAEWAKLAQNLGCPNCGGTGDTPDGKTCPACYGTGHGGGLMLKGGGFAEGLTSLMDTADKQLNSCPGNCGCESKGNCQCQNCPQAALNQQGNRAPVAPTATYMSSVEPQVGILYGDDGSTYHTSDGGATWNKVGGLDDDLSRRVDMNKADMRGEGEVEADRDSNPHCRACNPEHDKNCSYCAELDGKGMTPSKTSAEEHSQAEEDEDDDLRVFRHDHGAGQGRPSIHSEIHQQEHAAGRDPKPSEGECSDCGKVRVLGSDGKCGKCKSSALIKEAPYGIPKDKGGDSHKNDSKMEDCVDKVMKKGNDKESAIKICKKSLGFTKEESRHLVERYLAKQAAGGQNMSGSGCGHCGSPQHSSDSHPGGGHSGTPASEDRSLDYSDFQPQTAAAKPRKKPPAKRKQTEDEKKTEELRKKNEEIAGDVEDALNKLNKTFNGAAENPATAGPLGTSVDDLKDDVGTGVHSVPVTLITDHRGQLRPGADPDECVTCGEPMQDHAQWDLTKQAQAEGFDNDPLTCRECGFTGWTPNEELDYDDDGELADEDEGNWNSKFCPGCGKHYESTGVPATDEELEEGGASNGFISPELLEKRNGGEDPRDRAGRSPNFGMEE